MDRIYNSSWVVSTSSITGGTYDISGSETGLAAGTVTDLRFVISTGGTTASGVGTHAAATGTAPAPTVNRTGLSLADLTNDFRIGTANSSATPIRDVYYSIAPGNWGTSGNWSYTSGGASTR